MHSVIPLVSPSTSTLVLLIASGLIAPVPASAVDPAKIGGVVQVSDGIETYAYDPRVAADPAGNFLVAWQDADTNEVNGRAFWSTGLARGPVFQISNANDDIVASPGEFDTDGLVDLAADKAGNFLVAYNALNDGETGPCAFDKNCIWTKRLNADGNLAPADFIVGDPRLFSYGTLSYNQTGNPEIAADGEGNFIIAWEGYDADAEGVWARKLVGSGQVNGAQFRVNEHTHEYQGDGGQLDVAADEDGNFVLVWQDDNLVSPPYGGIVFRRFDKAKNPLGQQTQADPSGYDPHVAQLPDGTFMLAWFGSGFETVGRVFDPNGVPTGSSFEVTSYGTYPEIAVSAAGAFIVTFETEDGVGVRVFDATGAPTSSEIELDTGSYAYTPHVSAAANGDFVVVWNEGYDGVFAQRFQATTPTTEKIPVLGKVAILSNKIPDDFEKSLGKWKASGSEIEVPLRGSANDPRCNGDPDGTVKASVRFVSTASGQDVTIGLPCQHWTATGGSKVASVPKRGFKYSDGKRLDGPCNSVKITGTKKISVSCKGKAGVAAFPYDLQSSVSQDVLTAVLRLGLIEYCSEFQPFLDSSDGKKYKGKSFAPPAACP